MIIILQPPLQCDFAASPIKISGLFPCSLKLGWPGDLLWLIECSGDEAGPVLKPQEALGASAHRGGTLQPHGNKSVFACWRMRDHVEDSPVAQLRPSRLTDH